MSVHWWTREGLDYREDELHLGRQNLADLVQSAGTPTFVYDATRIAANLERIHTALDKHEVEHEIFFALKANRYLPLAQVPRFFKGRNFFNIRIFNNIRVLCESGVFGINS